MKINKLIILLSVIMVLAMSSAMAYEKTFHEGAEETVGNAHMMFNGMSNGVDLIIDGGWIGYTWTDIGASNFNGCVGSDATMSWHIPPETACLK